MEKMTYGGHNCVTQPSEPERHLSLEQRQQSQLLRLVKVTLCYAVTLVIWFSLWWCCLLSCPGIQLSTLLMVILWADCEDLAVEILSEGHFRRCVCLYVCQWRRDKTSMRSWLQWWEQDTRITVRSIWITCIQTGLGRLLWKCNYRLLVTLFKM